MLMQSTILALDRIGCVFVRFLVFNESENVLVGFHALLKAPVVRKEKNMFKVDLKNKEIFNQLWKFDSVFTTLLLYEIDS